MQMCVLWRSNSKFWPLFFYDWNMTFMRWRVSKKKNILRNASFHLNRSNASNHKCKFVEIRGNSCSMFYIFRRNVDILSWLTSIKIFFGRDVCLFVFHFSVFFSCAYAFLSMKNKYFNNNFEPMIIYGLLTSSNLNILLALIYITFVKIKTHIIEHLLGLEQRIPFKLGRFIYWK